MSGQNNHVASRQFRAVASLKVEGDALVFGGWDKYEMTGTGNDAVLHGHTNNINEAQEWEDQNPRATASELSSMFHQDQYAHIEL
ncbi:MAG TPA: hypothetical protein DEA55_08115 [Rhodospirillaceae bacterium]|nr:hypothetical protein [Rhodospirillaceae bacterium]